jgi:glycosyltransferase involved in cell wall biosynthesis
MRFLMLNWRDPKNPKAGGAERVSQAYLAGLVVRGHEVFWFANSYVGCKEEEVIEGIRIIRRGGKGTSIVRAVQWYKQQAPFDLVIDQHHGIPWFAPWWSKTNCIAYIHEVLGPIWGAFYPWPLCTIGRLQERWTHWLYRKVPFWVPSGSTKKALHKHGVLQVEVFFNGTDTIPVAELESKPLAPPIKLVAVARLAPNKRIDHAIETQRILRQGGMDSHLQIIGSGEEENHLRQLANRSELADHVSFAGQLNETEKNLELRRAHLLLHTSIREGWGLNVIEANAMGTPAVVYPVGGLVDSTLHNQTGIVTREETPGSLSEAVIQLLSTPGEYQRLRVNAWERSKSLQWARVIPPVCDWLEKQARKSKRINS